MSEQHRQDSHHAALAEIAAKIRTQGDVFTPETIMATIGWYAPLHQAVADNGETRTGVDVTRDLKYGPADRHRLDIFTPSRIAGAALPVLVFVHGGGFVGGDKSTPGSPFWGNVGLWAARHGMIGVTITYRLAPQHGWPAGSDDVALAMAWLREHLPARGGDPRRMFIMGQSAGAAHVAGYLARERSGDHQKPAGAVLVSGLYDARTMLRNSFFHAYFGEDQTLYEERTFLTGLVRTPVPLMVITAQYDPFDFLSQGMELLNAYLAAQRRLPRYLSLAGHNHLSTVLQLGTADTVFAAELLDFINSQD